MLGMNYSSLRSVRTSSKNQDESSGAQRYASSETDQEMLPKFVPKNSAPLIGLMVSPICFYAISVLKKRFAYDDALDAFGCHGVGGVFGGSI